MQTATGHTVPLVTQNWSSQHHTMHPDLVRAPSPWPHFQPGQLRSPAQYAPVCGGTLAAGKINHHAPTLRTGHPPQRRVDGSRIAGDGAPHHRPVDLADTPGRKQRLRADQSRPPQRDNQAAGGISIQPVRQPRPNLPAGQKRKPVLDTSATRRAGMHRQARRLVEYRRTAGPRTGPRELVRSSWRLWLQPAAKRLRPCWIAHSIASSSLRHRDDEPWQAVASLS